MKTLTPKVCAIITGLLMASAPAFSQSAPPAPAAPSHDYTASDATAFIMPRSRVNLFLDAGFQYMNIGQNYQRSFYGINVVFGWRINAWNKIQVELAGLGSYKDYGYNGSTDTWGMGNELFTYSFCIPLGAGGRWELRLSPSIGYSYSYVRHDYDYYMGYSHISGWETDGSYSFVYGAGIGVTCHVSKRIYLDASYRYLSISGPRLFGVTRDDMGANTFTVSCGWKL